MDLELAGQLGNGLFALHRGQSHLRLEGWAVLLTFLLHLLLGLAIVIPGLLFGALHLRNAWGRSNYRAVRAGLALYATVILMLGSGLVLTRFDFFAVNDPALRTPAYWLHVATPVLIVWLFILHRLAGKKIRYGPAIAWGTATVLVTAVALVPQIIARRGMSPLERVRSLSITGRPPSTRSSAPWGSLRRPSASSRFPSSRTGGFGL